MAEIVKFRSRADLANAFPGDDAEIDIDLVTAVDAAIRDLRDILHRWGEEESRRQAVECQHMLERALAAAI